MRLFALALFAFIGIETFAIRGFFTTSNFYDPASGPYIECVTSFEGPTFTLAKSDSAGLFQSAAELTIVISQDGKVVDFRKVRVDGPLVKEGEQSDFMSLERFSLFPGVYDLELTMRDANDPLSKDEVHQQNITISHISDTPQFSDIQLLAAYRTTSSANAFSKSGVDMIPYNSNFYPTQLNSLIFYTEAYNTAKAFGAEAPFVVNVCIIDLEGRFFEECRKMKREKSAEVVPMLHVLDISNLPSGEYKIHIELRDKTNTLVASMEESFSRSNLPSTLQGVEAIPLSIVQASFAGRYNQEDTLYALIQYHLPIASAPEKITIDNQLVVADLQMLQSFFYSFWLKRNPSDPEGAWLQYKKQIDEVDRAFTTKQKPGWRTDRGRVYLQYGPPSTRIIRNNDADYFPFELWHYYETNNNLHDRRFLFYDTTLNGDMELLHTDVPAEPKNHNWKQLVRTRPTNVNAGSASELNANQMRDPYSGDELEDLWYNPH